MAECSCFTAHRTRNPLYWLRVERAQPRIGMWSSLMVVGFERRPVLGLAKELAG